MDIRHLRNALLLSRRLHFTKASQELNIVQPALSRQIKQLEVELDITLFKRNKRSVELTEAGTYYLGEVEKLLLQLERAQEQAKVIEEGGFGELRIGFTHSVLQTIMPEVLEIIKALRPGIKTVLRELNNLAQFPALTNRELDLGFATNPVLPPNLFGKKISTNNFAVLLPLDHPVSAENYTDFSVFKHEEFIFPPMGPDRTYPALLASICHDAGFEPKCTHVTGSASTGFKLIEKGMGIGIEPVTSLYNQELPLKIIELPNIPQKAELTMIWNQDFQDEHPALLKALSETERYHSLP